MHLIPLNCTAKNGLKNVLFYIHFAAIKKLKTPRGNTSTVDSKLSSLYFNKVSLYHKSISHSIFVNGAKKIPFFFFLLYHMACRILVPRPGMEPRPTKVKLPNPNHWTTREFPRKVILNVCYKLKYH